VWNFSIRDRFAQEIGESTQKAQKIPFFRFFAVLIVSFVVRSRLLGKPLRCSDVLLPIFHPSGNSLELMKPRSRRCWAVVERENSMPNCFWMEKDSPLQLSARNCRGAL